MTAQHIRKSWEVLRERLVEMDLDYKMRMADIRAEISRLQQSCRHPDKAQVSVHGGALGWWCPDCGWQS